MHDFARFKILNKIKYIYYQIKCKSGRINLKRAKFVKYHQFRRSHLIINNFTNKHATKLIVLVKLPKTLQNNILRVSKEIMQTVHVMLDEKRGS